MIEKFVTSRLGNLIICLLGFVANLICAMDLYDNISKDNSCLFWFIATIFSCGLTIGMLIWRDLLLQNEELLDKTLNLCDSLIRDLKNSR